MTTRRTLWQILKGTTDNWLEDQASSISAALAFYCAFSLAPLLIIIVSIAGWIVGGELAYSYVGSQLTMLFGSSSADLILDAMRGDHTLFTTAEGIERLWEISMPLLEAPPPVKAYAPGSWGPNAIHQLVAPHAWRLPFERAWRDPNKQGS